MLAKTLIAASALATAASAATIYVDNHCNFQLYLTSAFGDAANDGVKTIAANTNNAWNGPVFNDNHEKHAITLSKSADMSSAMQNVYTFANGITYYSLSTIFGDPLKADGFRLDSWGNGFDIVSSKDRQGELENAYTPSNRDGNGAVFTDSNNADFTLSLCPPS